MAKITVTPDGREVQFSTKRGHPELCSESCKGVYKVEGDLYCWYFNTYAFRRARECIENEKKG